MQPWTNFFFFFLLEQKFGSSYLDVTRFHLHGGGLSEKNVEQAIRGSYSGCNTPGRVSLRGSGYTDMRDLALKFLRPPHSPASSLPCNMLAFLRTRLPKLWLVTLTDHLLAWQWEGSGMPVTSDTKYGTQSQAEIVI